ncbi:hypothetical protein P153DRAFT_422231 [Dothidotthia symphoricarpi CBS 119687]|uniref:C2H2-type domain-containing protein n=1 Tax=Dothidotthia symphoricarpi CBS 119687 TaxID=1392245 RepID=A0A6A6AGN3_9PLEO|nr:uncharacterized protein P153DRAFT_422231 [Dothidotthia symphoricarpi CBS 119687]KAF2130285.1 hypothetical protein P153DRAFT_422231 [Dothidotthia symphoricarpi CBS 119687]
MEIDEPQHFQFSTPQASNSFKRPRRSVQGSMPLGSAIESVSPSPRHHGHTHLAPTVIDHIHGLKHLDDQQILLLLQAARNGDGRRPSGPDRSSISTMGSRASSYLSVPSSRVPGMFSDHRSSVASTDSSFTHYSAASSRLSTASSRLSMISTASTPAPKNFACTFCDKALKSKPYWKSHEEEFHEQRLTWRCPDCEQIFHAGKRFREHHTKLHGCEHCKQPRESGQPTSRKASPCVKRYEIVMHDKDAWGCGFCCSLLTTWEERCEHIALHFEEKGSSRWNFTNVVLALLKQPEVGHAWNTLLSRRHGEDSQHWPTLTWEPKKCNRLRYKLETKWDTRAFDLQKLVQDTYDLAEIEAKDIIEDSPESTPEVSEANNIAHSEIVEFKLESSDFGNNHRLPSSHGLSHDTSMMDLDEPAQNMHHQGIHQPQWPVNADMSQTSMTVDSGMGAFVGYHPNMTGMSGEFAQPVVTQPFQQQQTWPNTGYVATPDLMNFQQSTYMNYNQPKEVIQVPTSQFATFTQYAPTNLVQSTPPTSRRYVPKLVNISGSIHRSAPQDQPPPPPPKDESQQNRFSRMIRRRTSQQNIKETSWHGELQWG